MSHRFGSFSADFSSSIFDSPYMLHDLGILPARFKQENLWSVVTKNGQAHTSSRLSGVRSTGLFPIRHFPRKSQRAVIPDCVVYAVKVYKWALCSKSPEFSISLVLIRFSYYNKRRPRFPIQVKRDCSCFLRLPSKVQAKIGARQDKINPLAHGLRLTAVFWWSLR